MGDLEEPTQRDLDDRLAQAHDEYISCQARGLSLNIARGKPSAEQLDLSMPLLDTVKTAQECLSEDGADCRNYGILDGLPEAKRLMACLLDDNPENVIVFGSSSLNVMYDTIARCLDFGTGGHAPWYTCDNVKWLCPVPGYDRHFCVTETFGIEMIPIPLTDDGPDMHEIEQLICADESIKGMWCVPKYSNPSGITYSDEVVRALAQMKCAADDFRIFWDNAYCVHHLYDDTAMQDHLLDIGAACRAAGNPDRFFKFASTSKITFPGSGIAAMASSPGNIAEIKSQMSSQIIGYDKINQLRHVRFLHDEAGIAEHMSRHAAILRPKFQLVLDKFEEELGDVDGCTWTQPRGGYFVLFKAPEGTAARIVELAREAGVTITGAGATWPYGHDPSDSEIRIAPTMPPLDELEEALDIFVCCVKLAVLEKITGR